MYLAVDQQWIEDDSSVVASNHATKFDLAGIGIDLDDGHVRAKRKSWATCGEIGQSEQLVGFIARCRTDVFPAKAHCGSACNVKACGISIENDVGGVGFEKVGRA